MRPQLAGPNNSLLTPEMYDQIFHGLQGIAHMRNA